MPYCMKSTALVAAALMATTCIPWIFNGFYQGAAIAADEAEQPGGIIAAQIRSQGFTCKDPVKAKADHKLSKPNEAVWLLQCKSEKYRVRLIPDMAAKVERIE